MKKLFRFPIGIYSGIFLAFLGFSSSGCGVWGDFTTYFNLYYNLSDVYSQAEASLKEQKKGLFDLEEVAVSGNATTLFNQVIEKSSKLLQFNGESSFVDDALFMLGKSFYYMQNYQKALRKFDELLTAQPNSSLALEAEFWAAKTQLRLRNFDDGLSRLKTVKEKAIKADDGNVLTLIYIEEIKFDMSNKNYVKSIDGCKSLIAYDYDSGISAETCFQLGKLYQLTNQYKDAVQAFDDVGKYSPTFDVKFNASVEHGKALRQVDQNEAALKVFQKLKSEAKYSDKYDIIDLELGLCYINLEKYKMAMTKLQTVDTTFASSVSAGVARFYLGKMLEEKFLLYDSAAYYYKKAASGTGNPELQVKAQNKVTVFAKFTSLFEQLKEQDKLLSYLNDSLLYVKDSIKYAEDTAKANKENLEAMKLANEKKSSRGDDRGLPNQNMNMNIPGLNTAKLVAPVYPKISADSIGSVIVKTKYDLGSIYFAEFNQIDTAMYYYNDILTNYPKSKMIPQTTFALGNCYQALNNKEKADSLFNYIYENYKTESVVNSAAVKVNKPLLELNFDPGKSLFLEAETLMKKKEYLASVKGFNSVFQSHPKSAFAPKALLASGWILENELKQLDSAASIYDSIVIRYPTTAYAGSVKAKLDVYKAEMAKRKLAAKTDSLHLASDSLKLAKAKTLAAAVPDSLKNIPKAAVAAAIDSSANKDLTAAAIPEKSEDSNLNKDKDKFPSKKKRNMPSLREIEELDNINNEIATFEKQIADLKAEKAKLTEKLPKDDPKFIQAMKEYLETKANLEKLPK